ncbi:hypothetical protein WN51_09438 [Melipona quadrifasciata]|uniref:Uncharacterized protein n=1 Tax=Melipona quadrifasciata TaxID=166423 RepID=A0A0N1ISY2_9HYME|nr:hypothetical protein WN51_09438 [Melipona quadrifasciata]
MMQCICAKYLVKVKVSRSYVNTLTSEQFEKWNGTEWNETERNGTERNGI